MIDQALSGGNTPAVQQATEDHVAAMPPDEVEQHLQTAAENANANGQPDVAQEIQGIIETRHVDPEELKNAAISYIKSNPQVLTHFAPSFAQGILNRVL